MLFLTKKDLAQLVMDIKSNSSEWQSCFFYQDKWTHIRLSREVKSGSRRRWQGGGGTKAEVDPP